MLWLLKMGVDGTRPFGSQLLRPKANKPFVILIKALNYIQGALMLIRAKTNLVLIGEGPTKTTLLVRGVKSGGGYATWHTCSLGVGTEGTMIKDIGIENHTAGIEKEQSCCTKGPNQACMITAQGRPVPTSVGGFVIQNCDIRRAAVLAPSSPIKAYLGRPWKEYSRTIIMQSNIDAFVDPEGWAPWNTTDFGLHTVECL
ncbi:hypothetical protein HAX54_028028 [Datura stramonium]|uniref:Pectinesterase catalytic domain-containing protein n=1 Tax=Datura stramonium TaxID=4076 RepID=A0ABS8V5M1_DATST|nr:hypothetical protein [Datura stramonium]